MEERWCARYKCLRIAVCQVSGTGTFGDVRRAMVCMDPGSLPGCPVICGGTFFWDVDFVWYPPAVSSAMSFSHHFQT